MKYLDRAGLQVFWTAAFAKIRSLIPTKMSDLANDAGYLNGDNLQSSGLVWYEDIMEIDAGGNLQPSGSGTSSAHFELDGSGDIMPRNASS